MRAFGARSLTALTLLAGAGIAVWQLGFLRDDYRAQLEPWVPFVIGGFAVLCGTLVFAFWRLAERSEFYFRFGERMPWAPELALLALPGPRGRALLVGHGAQADVVDLPPLALRVSYIAVFFAIGMITVDARAVALLRDTPAAFTRPSADWCPEPKPAAPPEVDPARAQGCQLVQRAYKLGYTKSLGSCAPREAEAKAIEVCRKRQRDEPYLHYVWRLFDGRWDAAAAESAAPGMFHRFGDQLDHVSALADSTADSVLMRARSSHHLFTNLPDPRPAFADRARAALEHGCGARLANLGYFPRMANTPTGRSLLVEHVVDQLTLNPAYKPVVAQCGEFIIHWATPPDTCARLIARPREVLAEQAALAPVRELLDWRRRKAELAQLHLRELGEPAPAASVASFQCLMFGDADKPVAEHEVELDGEHLRVREAVMAPLAADGASQIRLYKRLAELLAESFGYGRLTSDQSFAARPEDAMMVAAFRDPALLLTKLELLRDADLFLGNEWLTARADLLEVYPYHVHLKNFVEIFRRQYKLHRGRL